MKFRHQMLILLSCVLIIGELQLAPAQPTILTRLSESKSNLDAIYVEGIDAPGIAVAQDHLGYMWFAGSSGLYKYDGDTFIHYQHSPFDSLSLSFNRLESLHVDQNGTLWIGTFGGGLNRYERETDSFTHFKHDPNNHETISQDTVTAILETKKGVLWVGTHNGLNRYDPVNQHFIRYNYDSTDATSLSNDQIRVLYEDKEGVLWIGTGSPSESETEGDNGGLNRYNSLTDSFTRYLHDPRVSSSLSNNHVMSLFEDSRGTFWVGTYLNGLHSMNRKLGTFIRHPSDAENRMKIARPYFPDGKHNRVDCQPPIEWDCGGVSFIHEDQQGTLWIGGHNSGLHRYDVSTGAMSRFERSTHGFINDSFWTMYESGDGTLWIGNWGGMHKVITSLYTFPQFSGNAALDQQLGGPSVTSFHQTNFGELWIGVGPNGLDRLDMESGKITHVSKIQSSSGEIDMGAIWTMYEDNEGILWIGGESLIRYDPRDSSFTQYQHDPDTQSGLPQNSIRAIHEDKHGKIFLGTNGGGLISFDKKTEEVQVFHYELGNQKSISDNYVHSIYQDSNNRLWVATGNGLGVLNDSGEFESIIPGTIITSIFEDSAGRFWVGTWGQGLHLLDREKGSSDIFTQEEGLPTNYIGSILEEEQDILWITTANGRLSDPVAGNVTRFNVKSGTFKNISQIDGLPDIGFYYGSSLKTKNGLLLLGGTGGFTIVDPEKVLTEDFSPPRVSFNALRIFNEEVIPGPNAPIQQSISSTPLITLTQKQNDFTLDYVGINYRWQDGIRYFYRLDLYDKAWVNARSQRSARYSQLGRGRYTLTVKALDERGIFSTAPATVDIVILPHWWQRWWVILTGLVVMGMIGWQVYRFLLRVVVARIEKEYQAKSALFSNQVLESEEGLSEDEVFKNKVVTYMNDHLDKTTFNVEQFAGEFALSRRVFERRFKSIYNKSPKKLMIEMRMRKASELIKMNYSDIATIAKKVGYSDPNYFNKAFRKYYGETPKDYLVSTRKKEVKLRQN